MSVVPHIVLSESMVGITCGIPTEFSTTSTANRVYAILITGSVKYHFQWTRIVGGTAVVDVYRTSGSTDNNRFMCLTTLPYPNSMANWNGTQPQPGDVWSVRVEYQRSGDSNWSGLGPCCEVSFGTGGNMMLGAPEGTLAEGTLRIWPNPNKDGRLNLLFANAEGISGNLRVEFIDATGRQAAVRSANLAEGANSLTLDASGLDAGLYLVRANIAGYTYVKRLVME